MSASKSVSPEVRRLIERAWVDERPSTRETIEILQAVCRNENPQLRAVGVLVAELVGPAAPQVLLILRSALTDKNSMVRRMAARSLGRMGPAARSAKPALTAAAQDQDKKCEKAVRLALLEIVHEGKDTVVLDLGGGMNLDLVRIRPGIFRMGSDTDSRPSVTPWISRTTVDAGG